MPTDTSQRAIYRPDEAILSGPGLYPVNSFHLPMRSLMFLGRGFSQIQAELI